MNTPAAQDSPVLPFCDIVKEAARAAAQGAPARNRVVRADGKRLVEWEIAADGSVTMLTADWEPVIEDGKIVTFRPQNV